MAADDFEKFLKQEGKCLVWTGPGFGEKGYGLYKKTQRLAHREAFFRRFGYLPNAPIIQTCGNKRCCEEKHLVDSETGEKR